MFPVRARVFFRNTIYFFNLLRFIAIDIVQTMMSVATLYLFSFSSYMQKTKHIFGSRSTVLPKNESASRSVQVCEKTAPRAYEVPPGAPYKCAPTLPSFWIWSAKKKIKLVLVEETGLTL